MRRHSLLALFVLILLGSLYFPATSAPREDGTIYLPLLAKGGPVPAPVLKWQHGGCESWGCDTGWYASPAAGDVDNDGQPEVIGAQYDLFVLNGATGAVEAQIDPPGGRVWPGVVLASLEGDATPEIVTAQGSGYVNVYRMAAGNLQLVWSRQPSGSELRSLAVYDLENNGSLEVVVAATASSNQWTIYDAAGNVRSGWPQKVPGTPGYAAGCYNENVGVADIDGDGRGEIIGPSDVHYITAYQDNGSQIAAHSRYGSGKVWSQVGVHVDDAVDLRGYADCGVEHRPNFANTAPTLVDVNGDGVREVIVVGNVYNCGEDPYLDLYDMPFILKADRSRWSGNGYDWTAIPVPDGAAAPLSEDYDVIETAEPNPVVADLDGDGFKEILYASYDGRVHAYWLDKSEHGNWPYAVYQPAEGFYRFASEPVVVDLNNDGKAEVIFASWTQKGSYHTGKLYILDSLGNVLHEVDLPAAYGSSPASWNGALAAPTLANLDSDADLELVLNTAHSGFVAYDLPGSAGARILWGTGRGDMRRGGNFSAP